MEIKALQQGTEEWLRYRDNKIGGSEVAIIMGCNYVAKDSPEPDNKLHELWEIKSGLKKAEYFNNPAMARGTALEPFARERYEFITGIKSTPKIFMHDDYPFISASLDGISDDLSTVLEIKCPQPRMWDYALRGNIADYYVAQMMCQLLCSGAKLCHYFVYSETSSILFEVYRDEKYIEAMIEQCKKFHDCCVNKVPPKKEDFPDMFSKDSRGKSIKLYKIKGIFPEFQSQTNQGAEKQEQFDEVD